MSGTARRSALLIVVTAALLAGCSKDNGNKAGPKGQNVATLDLQTGQCIEPPSKPTPEVETVQVFPCTEAHTEELFAIVPYNKTDAGTEYPGDKVLRDFANGACLERYEDYVGAPYTDSSLFYTFLLPSPRSWSDRDDRDVMCFVTTTGEKLHASVKGSGR